MGRNEKRAPLKTPALQAIPTLPLLQTQASAKPRNRLDEVSRELTSQDKALPDWISLTTHPRTPPTRQLVGQK